jgi:hypothetical protein
MEKCLSELFQYQRFSSIPVTAGYAIESSWKLVENNNIKNHLFFYDINSVEEGENQVCTFLLIFRIKK